MAPGRERITAADAAVRAQPLMSTLALALALLSTTKPRGASSQRLAPPPPHENTTCDGVPYPFGVRGASLPGFEVVCGPNKEAMLPIHGNLYRINVVSVPESYVVIFAGPIRQVCYDRNGKLMPATGTGAMSLEGTPFIFSKRNNLVNIGCNYKVVANFTKPSGGLDPGHYFVATCTTACYGTTIGNSCSGEACCEVDIPASVNGTQSFTLLFERTMDIASSGENGTCSAVFFLDKDEQVFTSKDAGQGRMPLREALLPPGERRTILDWAIGNSTCDQDQGYNFDLVCNDMGVRLRRLT